MPETRFMRHFDKEGNELEPIPYEVSDEEVADEADRATCEKYLAKSSEVIKQPEIWWLLRYFGKRLGFEIKEGE